MDKTFSGSMVAMYWEKKIMDRFLRDPSSVWGHINPEYGGVRDANVPDWYAQQYFALLRKQEKQKGVRTIGSNSLQFDADTGNLAILGHKGSVQFAKADIPILINFLLSGPDTPMPVQGTSQAGIDDRPEMKVIMEQNLKALEAFALASSKAYPKSK